MTQYQNQRSLVKSNLDKRSKITNVILDHYLRSYDLRSLPTLILMLLRLPGADGDLEVMGGAVEDRRVDKSPLQANISLPVRCQRIFGGRNWLRVWGVSTC